MAWARRPRRAGTPPVDHEGFTRLYQSTSRELLAFLMRRSASAEAAADCLAETYRIAWEKRAQMPTGEHARLWLFGVARNVLRREFSRDARADAIVRELTVAIERAQALSADEEHGLTDALSTLTEIDREIITMGA